MKKIIACIFAVVAISTSNAQVRPEFYQEPPYIEVNGNAEKEIIPDEIYISIVLREKYDGKTKISIEEQETKLKEALKSAGINTADLYLSDANADYVKVRWKMKDVLTRKDYTLKLDNATAVGKVFQEFDKLQITDASVKRVNHSKLDSLQKEVRILAVKAAKQKAEYLLAAIGEQAGKPLIIRENEMYTPYPAEAMNVRGTFMNMEDQSQQAGSDADKNEIQFRKILVKASVYVKYSIK